MNNSLKIGELAKQTGCLVETFAITSGRDYCSSPRVPKEITGSIQTFTSNAFNLFGTAVR
jgi:hypothetical protein